MDNPISEEVYAQQGATPKRQSEGMLVVVLYHIYFTHKIVFEIKRTI